MDTLQEIPRTRFSSRKEAWVYCSRKERAVEPFPPKIDLITWNIDFMAERPHPRLSAALQHLRTDVLKCAHAESVPQPCCILLQEVHREAFHALQDDPWVRAHFVLVPDTPRKWPQGAYYGVATLVARSVPVTRAWMLAFGESRMQRCAVFVDVLLAGRRTLRVANTHLESLPEGAEARPVQMGLIAGALGEAGVFGGVVGGDMNCVRPQDEALAEEAELEDAWKGASGDKSGHTWGHQPRGRFPPGRLDRIFYRASSEYVVEEPRRIGVGLKLGNAFVSDHVGLLSTVRLAE